jgi:cyclin L
MTLADTNFCQDVSASVIYLTAKISASPRSLRSITNVYAYLLSPSSHLHLWAQTQPNPFTTPDPEAYYLSETSYITFRNRLLNIEGQILNALGFNTHVALPHPLAITYLQTLDVFSSRKAEGKEVAKKTVEYLNTSLLSPQMLYLTHQPNALATAAIYLSAREAGVKLPETEWWSVFDVEREELGFLVVGMGSLEGFVRGEQDRWEKGTGEGKVGMITREMVRKEMGRLGMNREGGVENENGFVEEDEETQMARLLDEKVASVGA